MLPKSCTIKKRQMHGLVHSSRFLAPFVTLCLSANVVLVESRMLFIAPWIPCIIRLMLLRFSTMLQMRTDVCPGNACPLSRSNEICKRVQYLHSRSTIVMSIRITQSWIQCPLFHAQGVLRKGTRALRESALRHAIPAKMGPPCPCLNITP